MQLGSIVYLNNMANNLGFRKEALTNEVCNQRALFTSTTWLTTWGTGRRLSQTRCATREHCLPQQHGWQPGVQEGGSHKRGVQPGSIVYLNNMASNLGYRKEALANELCNQGALFTSTTWLATWGSERRFSLRKCATREHCLPHQTWFKTRGFRN